MKNNIVLIGPMGSGKTTLGRMTAQAGRLAFTDTDDEIERRGKMTVPQLFAQYGEPHFRVLESEAAQWAARLAGYVIATGGGMVLREDNMRLLKATGVVIYLRCGVDTLLARTEGSTNRPLLIGDSGERRKRLTDLLASREPLYLRYADDIVDTDSGTSAGMVKSILCAFRD